MQSDSQSTSSSSSSRIGSPQRNKLKTKENLYRKFFKTSSGNKLLRQGQSPPTVGERDYIEGKENDTSKSKSNQTAQIHKDASRSCGETRNNASSSSSSSTFPILSGRQIYPQIQKVQRAQLLKVYNLY